MPAPVSLLNGTVKEAASYLAQLTVTRRRSGLVKAAVPAWLSRLGETAQNAGNNAYAAFQGLPPEARNALIGAGAGGAAGLGVGLLGTRKKNPLSSALTGALAGAALGGGGTVLSRYLPESGPPPEEMKLQVQRASNPAGLSVLSDAAGLTTPDPRLPRPDSAAQARAVAPYVGGSAGALAGSTLGARIPGVVNESLVTTGGARNPLAALRTGKNLRSMLSAETDPTKHQEVLDKLFNPQNRAETYDTANSKLDLARRDVTQANAAEYALKQLRQQHPGMLPEAAGRRAQLPNSLRAAVGATQQAERQYQKLHEALPPAPNVPTKGLQGLAELAAKSGPLKTWQLGRQALPLAAKSPPARMLLMQGPPRSISKPLRIGGGLLGGTAGAFGAGWLADRILPPGGVVMPEVQ